MARNKAISLFLTAVIVLTIAFAPLAVYGIPQLGLLGHAAQGGSNSLLNRVTSPVIPSVLACEGCSGGGGGPL